MDLDLRIEMIIIKSNLTTIESSIVKNDSNLRPNWKKQIYLVQIREKFCI